MRPSSASPTAIPDPFGTAELRARVLDAWAASPARFREDANAEEELARGGYRDRLVAELAQNAVDAAAPEPGRVRFELTGDQLLVANCGRPFTAAGIAALSSLRASAKRDEPALGRFGVGFAAVLALADEVEVASRGGPSVCWSAARTRAEVRARAAAAPGLGEELQRRGGQVPVLRLPFAGPTRTTLFDDSVVTLTLRDAAARELAAELLAGVDPTLPLTLPGLEELTVVRPGAAPQVWRCRREADRAELNGQRWLLESEHGTLPAELFTSLPAEERARAAAAGYRHTITVWARPDGGPLPAGTPATVRAPQPTDEPVSLPVLISVPLPVDVTRRRSLASPLRDALLARCAAPLARLAARLTDPLALVPVGFAAGEVDALIRQALLAALPEAPVLPGGRRGREAAVLDLGPATGPAAQLLADVVPGLLGADWSTPGRRPGLAVLGVRRLDTAAVVAELAGLSRPPAFWERVYAALAAAPDPDALGALPVPLADGRLVQGARGALLPAGALEADPAAVQAICAAALGAGTPLRVVHPAARHPLLGRLGARLAGPTEFLEALHPAVLDSIDLGGPDADALAAVVLALLELAGSAPGRLPWLAELALPGADGERHPAADLVHPEAPLRPLLAPDADLAVLDAGLAARWPLPVWEAVGVLTSFTVLELPETPLGEPGGLVDSEADYHRAVAGQGGGRGVVIAGVAVRDLELVGDWPRALAVLAADPRTRAAVTEPAPGGWPSYTGWWLAAHPVLGGLLPGEWLAPGVDPGLLAGLYEAAPAVADPAFLAAIGARTGLAGVLADPDAVADLLDRLGDASRVVGVDQARRLYAAAALALQDLAEPPEPPLSVRVAGQPAVLPAAAAVLVDAPDLLALVDRPVVPAPASRAAALSRLLGVPLASSLGPFPADGTGETRPVPVAVPGAPTSYQAHQQLTVSGRPVSWRWTGGVLHADGEQGLGYGLAWASGHWERRHALVAQLRRVQGGGRAELEDALEELA